MRFQYNGKFYAIWFKHHSDPGTARLPKVRYTECTIAEITGPTTATELITEDAFCADGDNYNKAIGRKFAFTRALKKVTTDRNFRRAIGMAYWNRNKRAHTPKAIDGAVKEAKPLSVVCIDSARA